MTAAKTAVLLGVTADIGREIAARLLDEGWAVVGLGRDRARAKKLCANTNFSFFHCDLGNRDNYDVLTQLRWSDIRWDLFASFAGTMLPIGKFFDVGFGDWQRSLFVNLIGQLDILHGIWPKRNEDKVVDVMFMAGGGTNNPFTNYSAYCLSKIALIKMCELLHDEESDVNAFIIGPGFVKTRMHDETIEHESEAGASFDKTTKLLTTPGTSFDDIYAHMKWCMEKGRSVAGGRNFSTVHDPWRRGSGSKRLAAALSGDRNAYRLRREEPWR